ncbi:hypothetical protein [Hymenobacter daeguensis]
MTYQQVAAAMALGASLAACAQQQEKAFPYPKMVVDAHEQAHYKTALWCAYTSYLDSSVCKRQPLHDSLRAALQQLVSYHRTLLRVNKGPEETEFHFNWNFHGRAAEGLFNNCRKYAPNASQFSPVVAVWVNNKDGLIDSVLDGNNVRYSPGPAISQVDGKWHITGPPDRNNFSYNIDQPCKAAFLRANRNRLSGDLLLLCKERKIFVP